MSFGPGNPFWAFAMEAEGRDDLISTREAKINAVIKEVRAYPQVVMPEYKFKEILKKHKLTDIKSYEIDYIRRRL